MRISRAEQRCRAAMVVLVAAGFLAFPGHALAAGGQISGRVTDAVSNLGVGSVQVDVYDSGQGFVTSTQTSSDGTYIVSGLVAGSYEVGFVPTTGNYLSQFYDGEPSLAAADAVTVSAGTTTLGINAALAAGGQISGTVTDAVSHLALGSVEVDAYDAGHNFVTSTQTATDGTYTLSGLPTGSYEVGFVPAPAGYAPQFYNGRASLAAADVVPVTAGSATAGVDAALTAGGLISGTVTDAFSTPVAGVEVDVYDSADTFVTSTQTAVDGSYTVSGLFPGSYEVGFVPTSGGFASQFYSGKASLSGADAVPVSAGATTVLMNAALAAGGQIAGTVTDAASGAVVGRAQVVVYDSSDTVVASASTAADGTYAIAGLVPGTYRVGFFPLGPYAVQFYSGQAVLATAAGVTVAGRLTAAGIDAALQPPASTLSVALAGTGSGTITGTGISCPGACSQSYATDTFVTLTAAAAAGSTFTGWSGGGCGAAPVCTVALASSLALTADFSANPPAVSPPSNRVLPSVSGGATSGQTLSAHTGSWSGTSPLAYAYHWQRCAPGCGSIAGATGSSYRLANADTGARILVVVTASNAAGRVSAGSASVGPVLPSVAQIQSLLSGGLVPSGRPAHIAAILKAGGYTLAIRAAAAGQELIRWYLVPAGAHLTKGKAPKPLLVATGRFAFPRAGSGRLKVKLSAAGRRDLKHAQRIRLSAKASFSLTGRAPVSLIKRFRLRR